MNALLQSLGLRSSRTTDTTFAPPEHVLERRDWRDRDREQETASTGALGTLSGSKLLKRSVLGTLAVANVISALPDSSVIQTSSVWNDRDLYEGPLSRGAR